jgi:O-antigen/teichoic acid export membrane protein
LSSLKTATFYVAIIMVIKSLAGLIALKVQATILQPVSFAILSQFVTVSGLVTNISSSAVTAGMTVLLARAGAASNAARWIRSGQLFSMGLSFLISIICVGLFFYRTDLINISPLPRYLFLIIGISPWLITQSSIAQARLTSSFQLKRFTVLSNASAIAVAILIIILTFYFGVIGSALAVATGTMLTASILLFFATNEKLTEDFDISKNDLGRDIFELLRFSSAMLVSICAVPISQILIRKSIVTLAGAEQGGYWSATLRLSDVYMQFFGLLLITFILPKISAKTEARESRQIFMSYLWRLSFIGAIVLIVVYVLREQLVVLALAQEFRPATDLLPIQLLGDFFRIILSFFFWFAYGQNLRVLAALEELLQGGLFYFFYHIRSDALGAVKAHLMASVANTIIIGACFLYVFSSRRETV